MTSMRLLTLHNLAQAPQRFLQDVSIIQDLMAEGLIEPTEDGHGWTMFRITPAGRKHLKEHESRPKF